MSLDEAGQRTARQRATAACEFCRQRKRRCNGERPVCFNCQTAGVECAYADVEQRRIDVKTSLSAIGDRLDRLEAAMTEHSNALNEMKHFSPTVSTPLSHFSEQGMTPSMNLPRGSPHGSALSYAARSGTSNVTMNTNSDVALPPMTIPLWHSTTTQSLLSCQKVKSLVGEFPNDVFLRIEERRTLPASLRPACTGELPGLPSLDPAVADSLFECYFQSVNMQHPILDYDQCLAQYHMTSSDIGQSPLESALVLVILALAEVARTEPPDRLDSEWSPGSAYLLPSLSVALHAYLNSSTIVIALPQCFYLAALYYNFIARPLDSWKYVHMASTTLQRLWIRSKDQLEMNGMANQPLIRLCWAVFSLECDLIAEHHLPRSGVETLVDGIQLPLCGESPTQSMLAWLAELSARRLLNRVHHVMYAGDQEYLFKASILDRQASRYDENASQRLLESSLKISKELDEQLNTWYDLIPQIIKPDLDQVPTTIQDAAIILRYHSAKDIILRPFLLFVCSLPATAQPPQFLIEICQTAIYSCRQYIHIAEMRLRESSASTEINIHSVFASTIIVTIAALNPWLKEYVLDINSLQEQAMCAIQRWAFDGSCIQAMALMLGAIQNKTKMLQADF